MESHTARGIREDDELPVVAQEERGTRVIVGEEVEPVANAGQMEVVCRCDLDPRQKSPLEVPDMSAFKKIS
jgi:hypothetical protein